METSKYFIMMRKDGKQARAFESKFEREIGDRINYNGNDYYVISLEPCLAYAGAFLATFGFSDTLDLAKRVLPTIFK